MGSFGSNLFHWSLVAQGRAHYVLTDTVGGYWDLGGHLLVSEAGGTSTDALGNEPVPGCQMAFGSANGGAEHAAMIAEFAKFYEGYQGFR